MTGTKYMDSRGCTYGGDYHHPYQFDWEDWPEKEKLIFEAIDTGMKPQHAVEYAGFWGTKWYTWYNMAVEDMENGCFDSPLVKFILKVAHREQGCHKKLMETAMTMANEDKNSKMVAFLLERRFGYKQNSSVEVSGAEDTNFNINIVSMEDKESD